MVLLVISLLLITGSSLESVFLTLVKKARDTLSTHLSQATSLNDLRDIVITPDVIRDSIAHLNEGNLMVSDSVQIMSFVHPFHWNSFLHPYFLLVFVRDMYQLLSKMLLFNIFSKVWIKILLSLLITEELPWHPLLAS